MKKPVTKSPDPVEQFTHYVSGAIKSFMELMHTWRGASAGTVAVATKSAAEPVAKVAKAARGLHQASGQFPWDKIVKVARKVLEKDPTKSWKIGELCQVIKKSCSDIVSATGMHFGLLPRLKAEKLIVQTGKGVFTGRPEGTTATPKAAAKKTPAKIEKKKAMPSPKKAAPVKKASAKAAKAKPVPPRMIEEMKAAKVAEKKKPAVDNSLLAACGEILDADPFKVWTGSELVKAVREAGVNQPSWTGMHFTLPALLRKAKLVEDEGKGFRAAVRPAAAGGAPAEGEKKE